MLLVKKDFRDAMHERGVPHSVLYGDFPDDDNELGLDRSLHRLMSHIEVPREGDTVIIDKKKQSLAIKRFETTSRPYFMIASGRNFDALPCQLALLEATKVIEKGKDFLWHAVDGSTRDDLRDGEKKLPKDCDLLIISNIGVNSTSMKLEKVRDILTKYSHIRRIVAMGGADPIAWTKLHLNIKADIFVLF